ncbi:jg11544 [Pararge aegeria aegeria]|uniref:Jg11544 protein n=1 Tax=Pararge aegeria aegeria TaxID=348720 RepID=A0A8S4RNC6_9NEOP|nr:jg11544 [Pararge aegeria aegeria]
MLGSSNNILKILSKWKNPLWSTGLVHTHTPSAQEGHLDEVHLLRRSNNLKCLGVFNFKKNGWISFSEVYRARLS